LVGGPRAPEEPALAALVDPAERIEESVQGRVLRAEQRPQPGVVERGRRPRPRPGEWIAGYQSIHRPGHRSQTRRDRIAGRGVAVPAGGAERRHPGIGVLAPRREERYPY